MSEGTVYFCDNCGKESETQYEINIGGIQIFTKGVPESDFCSKTCASIWFDRLLKTKKK